MRFLERISVFYERNDQASTSLARFLCATGHIKVIGFALKDIKLTLNYFFEKYKVTIYLRK